MRQFGYAILLGVYGKAALLTLIAIAAQSQMFEVASLKPSTPASGRGSEGGPGTSDPTRYRRSSATLQDLIATAWHLGNYFQISSRQPIDKETFDLAANVPSGATREQMRVMLQNLLSERFHLKVHMESREFTAYELAVSRQGAKLKESVPGASPQKPSGDQWPDLVAGRPDAATRFANGVAYTRGQQEPVSMLAGMLRLEGNPPVVDKTGLTGNTTSRSNMRRPSQACRALHSTLRACRICLPP